MATLNFSTYSELQSSALSFMDRSDTAEVKGWIALAEARLNRKLSAVEVDATLTGTASSRVISVSALSVERPLALMFVNDDGDEVPLVQKSLATILFNDDAGEPSEWAWDEDDAQIVFDRPLDAASSFRLVYRERFALSDSATSNWLLTNHPDVYLAATLLWGAGYREETNTAASWKVLLDEGLFEIRREIAKRKGSQLTFDPALSGMWPFRGVNLTGSV